MKRFILEGISYDMDAPKKSNFLLNQRRSEKSEDLDKLIQEYLINGFIEEAPEKDLYSLSPVYTIPRAGGSSRLIFSAERLNKYFLPDSNKLPSAMEPLYKMHKYACKIDFSNAYHHFKLEEEFSRWFGFRVRNKTYRFRVMPFGWNMAPYLCFKLFQPLIKSVRRQWPQITSYIYFDDSLYTSNNEEVLSKQIGEIVNFYKSLGIAVNDEKSIMKPQTAIEWLGFLYERKALTLTDKLVKATEEAARQYEAKRNVVTFMTLTGYLAFTARVVRGTMPMVSRLMSELSPEMRMDRANHFERFETSYPSLIKSCLKLVKLKPRFQPQVYGKTFSIWVDASEQRLGFWAGKAQMKSIVIQDSQQWGYLKDDNILALEAAAIHEAIVRCPSHSNLYVYSDSLASYWAFRKGLCHNQNVQEIVSSALSKAMNRGVAFIINYVPTEENPADYPSRNKISREIGWAKMWTPAPKQMSYPALVRWLDVIPDKPEQPEYTRVFNLLQNKKRRATAIKKNAEFIEGNLDYFTDYPKSIATSRALLDSVRCYGSIPSGTLKIYERLRAGGHILPGDIRKATEGGMDSEEIEHFQPENPVETSHLMIDDGQGEIPNFREDEDPDESDQNQEFSQNRSGIFNSNSNSNSNILQQPLQPQKQGLEERTTSQKQAPSLNLRHAQRQVQNKEYQAENEWRSFSDFIGKGSDQYNPKENSNLNSGEEQTKFPKPNQLPSAFDTSFGEDKIESEDSDSDEQPDGQGIQIQTCSQEKLIRGNRTKIDIEKSIFPHVTKEEKGLDPMYRSVTSTFSQTETALDRDRSSKYTQCSEDLVQKINLGSNSNNLMEELEELLETPMSSKIPVGKRVEIEISDMEDDIFVDAKSHHDDDDNQPPPTGRCNNCKTLKERIDTLEQERGQNSPTAGFEIRFSSKSQMTQEIKKPQPKPECPCCETWQETSDGSSLQEDLDLRLQWAVASLKMPVQRLDQLRQQQNSAANIIADLCVTFQTMKEEKVSDLQTLVENYFRYEKSHRQLNRLSQELTQSKMEGQEKLKSQQRQATKKVTEIQLLLNQKCQEHEELRTRYDTVQQSKTKELRELQHSLKSLEDANASLDQRVQEITRNGEVLSQSLSQSEKIRQQQSLEFERNKVDHDSQCSALIEEWNRNASQHWENREGEVQNQLQALQSQLEEKDQWIQELATGRQADRDYALLEYQRIVMQLENAHAYIQQVMEKQESNISYKSPTFQINVGNIGTLDFSSLQDNSVKNITDQRNYSTVNDNRTYSTVTDCSSSVVNNVDNLSLDVAYTNATQGTLTQQLNKEINQLIIKRRTNNINIISFTLQNQSYRRTLNVKKKKSISFLFYQQGEYNKDKQCVLVPCYQFKILIFIKSLK